MAIKIPEYFWFSNCIAAKDKDGNLMKGHPYSGSAGADAFTGFMSAATLSFTVVLTTLEDDSVIFRAECWREQPWVQGKGKEKTHYDCAQFENSEESIAKIEAWLNEHFDAIAADGQ